MPPVAVTVTVEELPLHVITVAETEADKMTEGSVMVIEAVAVQPFASLTVKL